MYCFCFCSFINILTFPIYFIMCFMLSFYLVYLTTAVLNSSPRAPPPPPPLCIYCMSLLVRPDSYNQLVRSALRA